MVADRSFVRPVKSPVLFLFVALAILFPSRVRSEEQDILDSLKGHELEMGTEDPQTHQLVPSKYGDPYLARAEEDLSDIPRPWTVSKMIGIFKKETAAWPRRIVALPQKTNADAEEMERQWRSEVKRCRYLARVLAASRDPRAVVALGDMLDTEYPDNDGVVVALFDYFVHDMFYGLSPEERAKGRQSLNGLDYTIPATTRWWNNNKARLRDAAAALGKAVTKDDRL